MSALRILIRDVANTMPDDANPTEIAAEVINKAGDELSQQFLLELVSSAVYDVLTASRNSALNRGGPVKSSRVEARARWWDRFCSARVPVGGNQWKRLGDCSRDDVEHLIAVRESQIEAIGEQIGKYRRLVDAMARFACDRVSDLSPELVDL